MDPVEALVLIGILFVVAVAASVATYARMKPSPTLPGLDPMMIIPFRMPSGEERDFVLTHITWEAADNRARPGQIRAELQDRASYERERTLPWYEEWSEGQ